MVAEDRLSVAKNCLQHRRLQTFRILSAQESLFAKRAIVLIAATVLRTASVWLAANLVSNTVEQLDSVHIGRLTAA